MKKKIIIGAVVVILLMIVIIMDTIAGQERNEEFDRLHETAQDYTDHDKDCLCEDCYIVEEALDIRNQMESSRNYGEGLYRISIETVDETITFEDGRTLESCHEIRLHYKENAPNIPTEGEVWNIIKEFEDSSENTYALRTPVSLEGYRIKVTNDADEPMGSKYILN